MIEIINIIAIRQNRAGILWFPLKCYLYLPKIKEAEWKLEEINWLFVPVDCNKNTERSCFKRKVWETGINSTQVERLTWQWIISASLDSHIKDARRLMPLFLLLLKWREKQGWRLKTLREWNWSWKIFPWSHQKSDWNVLLLSFSIESCYFGKDSFWKAFSIIVISDQVFNLIIKMSFFNEKS